MPEFCYQAALISKDKPQSADIDVKAYSELGRLSQWLSQQGYGDYWEDVLTYMGNVIDLYNKADPDVRLRIGRYVARAHIALALRTLALSGDDLPSIQSAQKDFQDALKIYQDETDPSYAMQFIIPLQTQVAQLEATLHPNASTTPGG